jgi:hypothetical protein
MFVIDKIHKRLQMLVSAIAHQRQDENVKRRIAQNGTLHLEVANLLINMSIPLQLIAVLDDHGCAK